jgi:hypothetical protein
MSLEILLLRAAVMEAGVVADDVDHAVGTEPAAEVSPVKAVAV